MKNRLLLYIFTLLVLISGCTENETPVYSAKPSVYFMLGRDSLNYTFAGYVGDTATVSLEIALLGDALKQEKGYALRVRSEGTTAVEGVHYKKIDENLLFPVDTFLTVFPLEVYRVDKELQHKTVYLNLEIVDTDDIDAGYPSATRLRVGITDQLIKPYYWDSYLKLYYSDYSRVKHNQCIIIQGHDFPPTETEAKSAPYSAAYWMVMGRAACEYFLANPTEDEHGNLIPGWQPF